MTTNNDRPTIFVARFDEDHADPITLEVLITQWPSGTVEVALKTFDAKFGGWDKVWSRPVNARLA